MERRKVGAAQLVSMLLLSIILIAILWILLSTGAGMAAFNLWLVVVCFLVILGFTLPFFLIAFDIISAPMWLRSFRWMAEKIPMISRPSITNEHALREGRGTEKEDDVLPRPEMKARAPRPTENTAEDGS